MLREDVDEPDADVVAELVQQLPPVRMAVQHLADRVGTLHVFLHGSEADRLAATMRGGEGSEEEARRVIRHSDANRAAYMKQVYNQDWLKPHHYHLLIDSGRFGWERTADIIVGAAGLL